VRTVYPLTLGIRLVGVTVWNFRNLIDKRQLSLSFSDTTAPVSDLPVVLLSGERAASGAVSPPPPVRQIFSRSNQASNA
jgi:hypothetical protein